MKDGRPHTCHAIGCDTPTVPDRLMCAPHWRRVPSHLQAAVWATYRPGQDVDGGKPSGEWLIAARAAIASLERPRSNQATLPGFK